MKKEDWKELLFALDAFKQKLEGDLEDINQGRGPTNREEMLEEYLASFSDIPAQYHDLYLEVTRENIHPVPIQPFDSDTGTYPAYIMRDVRLNLGLEDNDTSCDPKIMAMSQDEVFRRVMEWDGLINYGGIIQTWIKDIYGINLSELPARSHDGYAPTLDSKVKAAAQRAVLRSDQNTSQEMGRF